MGNLSRASLGLALLLTCVGSASADVIATYTASVGPETPSFSDTVDLQAFNPSLGTLNSVTITASASFTIDLYILGNGAGSNNYYMGSYAWGSVDVTNSIDPSLNIAGACTQFPGLGMGAATAINCTGLAGSTPLESDAHLNPNSYDEWTPPTVTASASESVLPADFAAYEGTGLSVSLNFDANDFAAHGTGTGGVAYGAMGDDLGTVSIAYDYSPTGQEINQMTSSPEPASMALLGSALLGLGLLRKYRKS